MDKFNVLPTDPRFMDLTEAQVEFLWMQHLDNTGILDKVEAEMARKKEQEDMEAYASESEEGDNPADTDYQPMADSEHYEDPEFDDYWNETPPEPNEPLEEDDSDFEEV
ncbi:hypothetical protein EalM132_00077 [Exiguobacterium phage vB_EalM-132]|nr:hypothetical protein EalM132_00077 [Exiguobacterium phage vB_EalM-132]